MAVKVTVGDMRSQKTTSQTRHSSLAIERWEHVEYAIPIIRIPFTPKLSLLQDYPYSWPLYYPLNEENGRRKSSWGPSFFL